MTKKEACNREFSYFRPDMLNFSTDHSFFKKNKNPSIFAE